jgi:hypothetical protein
MKRWCLLMIGLWTAILAWGQATPPGIPTYRIDWQRDTLLCDYLFLSTERFVLPTTLPSTAMLIDRRGYLAWYCTSEDNLFTFSPQYNGTLAFNVADDWYELDSSFSPTLYPTCSGVATDFHDFIHLANGHTMQLCNDDTTLDLRGLYTASGQQGDSAASVRYAVVEERDASGLLVRRWRGIDHFAPTDTDTAYFDFPWYLELNHTNSLDYDGQYLLLSHRNNHEVTLVDWATGQVRWRLGGPNNDFFYLNDGGFNAQHDARFVGAGQVSLLDNRSIAPQRTPRAVVYALDTTLWLATKIYERAAPTLESNSMGSYRQLPNGDGLVAWGLAVPQDQPELSYYHPNGTKVWDLYLENQHHVYRAVCGALPFPLTRPQITCDRPNDVLTLQAVGNHASYLWSTGATTAAITVTDTGDYQLYVPLGMGYVGSNVLHITDVDADCPSTASADVQAGVPRDNPLVETTDVLGRVVTERIAGQVYVERYRDGRCRKVVQW